MTTDTSLTTPQLRAAVDDANRASIAARIRRDVAGARTLPPESPAAGRFEAAYERASVRYDEALQFEADLRAELIDRHIASSR